MDDRRLDEFLGAPSGEESGEDADASTERGSERSAGPERDDGDRPEEGSDGDETEDIGKMEEADQPAETEVTPAALTYRWTPDGAACARCGTTVQRRWVDDGDAVCANCKEW